MRLVTIGILVITISATLSACGASGRRISNDVITANIDGLQLDESASPTVLYVRPGAPPLSTYGRFMIDPVQVNYADRRIAKLKQSDIDRLQVYFRDAVIKEIQDGGYEVVSSPKANTMQISLTILSVKTPSALANVSVLLAPVALSVGDVTVEAVFSDAVSGRTDAVAVSRSVGSRVLKASPWSTWADVKSAFDQWAKGIRKAIERSDSR